MHILRTRGLALVALAIMVIAGACSSQPAPVPVEESSGIPPFDAVLIELFGTTDTEAYLAEAERQAAELVVSCMADAGFEFEIPPASPAAATFDDTDLAVAQQSGFGIIAGFRDQIANVDVTATGEDPNVTYLSTLSSSEIARFLLTLDGVEPEAGQLKDDAGCNGTASDIAYADWVAFSEGLASYTTMGEERDTHPDWVAARLLWRDCMIERGFDYTEPDAIRTDVIARMRETVNSLYPGGQLPIVESGDGVALDPALDDLLAELTQFEVAAATANVECTAPLAADFAAVEFEVQQAFVDRNRSTIDELLGR